MTTPRKIHIELDLSLLDDPDRLELLAGMQRLAPQSPLFANPSIQATFGKLLQSGDDLAQADQDVVDAEVVLANARQVRLLRRGAFDGQLLLLKALVEADAPDDSAVSGMGFKARPPKRAPAPLVAPPGIDVRDMKRHGQFTVSAQESGPRQHYTAEISLNPDDPNGWKPLPGNGKSRKVTGYKSGTVVWIRFAMVRGNAQSAWSVAQAVTVP